MVLFRPLCKYVARVERLRDIVPTLKAAIQVVFSIILLTKISQAATSGCPGPVFVEFPVDVLYPFELVMKEVGLNPNAKGFIQVICTFFFSI